MYVCIITVTLNDKENLLRTIRSIRKNKKLYHKFFIIDGYSTDNTLEIIKRNIDIIDDYISEKDGGIYDAMNKALKFSTNEDFIYWLNAGDELLDWSEINMQEINAKDCAFFPVISKISDSTNFSLLKPKIRTPYNERNFFPTSFFMHQGFIIKSKVFESLKYDLNIGLQAENLLMSQCIQRFSYIVFDIPLSVFSLEGVSNFKFKEVHSSYLRVAKSLGFSLPKVYFFQRKYILKYYLKRIIPISVILWIRQLNFNIK